MTSTSGNRFRARSPTRIDLAGGTLDLWPLFTFVGGATTINFGIDIFTEAEFAWNDEKDESIRLDIQDRAFHFLNLMEFLSESAEPLVTVLQEVLRYLGLKSPLFDNRGFSFQSKSMSPVGGGLGGSSSLLITYLKLFEQIVPSAKLAGLPRIHLAHNLEARVLKTPTGTQDYFPPTFSGLNIIRYTDEGKTVEVREFPAELQNSFFLVYTGRPHHSGLNNFDVIQKVVGGDQNVFASLQKIRDITLELEAAFSAQAWTKIPKILNAENAARVELSPGFTSLEITQLQQFVIQDPECALKICGAGGGGCVLIWAAPEKHARIQTECRKAGFQILKPKATVPSKDS